MVIRIYVDGLAEPSNPGTATFGYVIYRDGTKLKENFGLAGYNTTNNYAEYTALTEALKEIMENSQEEIIVFSDSRLVVNQMNGLWKIKKGKYKEKMEELMNVLRKFRSVKFVWIPREENKEADMLSRKAYMIYSKLSRRAGSVD